MGKKERAANRKGEVSLCKTCTWGHVQKGYAESEEAVFCTYSSSLRRVDFRVRQCSDYSDRRLPSLFSMEKIAYILLEDKPNRKAGFVTVRQFLELEGEDAEIVPSSQRVCRR